MHDDELIRMANQIADYFKAYPREEAVPGIATHIRKFWEPRMRRRLLAISADAAEKLHPLAQEALPLIPVPAA